MQHFGFLHFFMNFVGLHAKVHLNVALHVFTRNQAKTNVRNTRLPSDQMASSRLMVLRSRKSLDFPFVRLGTSALTEIRPNRSTQQTQ